jgi:hypothetical protein
MLQEGTVLPTLSENSHKYVSVDTFELYESPFEIDDLITWAEDPAKNAGRLEKLKEDPSFKEIDQYNGDPIYSSGNHIFALKGAKISFFVQWIEHNFPGSNSKYATQIMVWRDRLDVQEGITKHVFWNILYPKNNAIMTDSSQTKQGRQFWRSRVGDALGKNIPVYFVNLGSWEARLIKDTNDYERAAKEAYGREPHHYRLRLLITQQEFGEDSGC